MCKSARPHPGAGGDPSRRPSRGPLRPALFFPAIAFIALSGCGYRFAGRGSLPPDIRTIAIPVFVNRTAETRVENLFTSFVVDEFVRTRRVEITDESRADAVLKGSITAYTTVPAFFGPDGRVRRYRVTVVCDAELVKKGGEVLWRARGLTENEDYDALPDILLTKAAERRAAEAVARDLAEQIHDRVFESF